MMMKPILKTYGGLDINEETIVVISGPPASGKTINAELFLEFYGRTSICDDGQCPLRRPYEVQPGALLLVTPEREEEILKGYMGLFIVPVKEAIKEAGGIVPVESFWVPAMPGKVTCVGQTPLLPRVLLAQVFDLWAKRYAEDPAAFDEVLDAEGKAVEGYGERCAVHFSSLVDELLDGEKESDTAQRVPTNEGALASAGLGSASLGE